MMHGSYGACVFIPHLTATVVPAYSIWTDLLCSTHRCIHIAVNTTTTSAFLYSEIQMERDIFSPSNAGTHATTN